MKATLADATDACVWGDPDEDGFKTCLTRSRLYQEVLYAEGHEGRYQRAIRAWRDHHCTIEGESGAESAETSRGTADGAPGQRQRVPEINSTLPDSPDRRFRALYAAMANHVTEPVGERLGQSERRPASQDVATASPAGATEGELVEETPTHRVLGESEKVRERGQTASGGSESPTLASSASRLTNSPQVAEAADPPAGHPLTLAIRAYTEAVENRVTDRSEAARDRVGEAYAGLWDAIEEYRESAK
jgi:hypothetical protein